MSMTILVGIYFTFFFYIRPEFPSLRFFFWGGGRIDAQNLLHFVRAHVLARFQIFAVGT
jgi:hypothetical protein